MRNGYRSGRIASEIARPLILSLALFGTLTLGACSFSIPPLAGAAGDETTGSLPKKTEMRLAPDLGQEDWRRAKGALGLALDPQGNGRTVKWDNPDTHMSGDITPIGPPFVEHDEICRRFSATVQDPTGVRIEREGRACKVSADDWDIKQVAAVKPASSRPVANRQH